MQENIYLTSTRVFIAGILMPTISITINSSIDKVPTATIELPPRFELVDMGRYDRVPVQIFQRESYNENHQFILIFDGYIVSSSYSSNIINRSISIQASGVLDILEDAKVKFLRTFQDDVNGTRLGENLKATNEANVLASPALFIQQGLSYPTTKEVEKRPPIKYPSDYLQNILLYLQGANTSAKDASAGPDNSSTLAKFYQKYTTYIQAVNRFVRVPYFDESGVQIGTDSNGAAIYLWGKDEDSQNIFPILKGFKTASLVKDFLTSSYQSQPMNTLSCRQLIDLVTSSLEFEFAHFSTPAYFKSKNFILSNWEYEPLCWNNWDDKEKRTPKDRLGSCCIKPILTSAIPPKCNIMFRSQVTSLSFNSVFKGAPTRVQMLDTESPIATLFGSTSEIKNHYLTRLYPSIFGEGGAIDPDSVYSPIKPEDAIKSNMQLTAIYMLTTEDWTGPWIQEIGAPAWWRWLNKEQEEADDSKKTDWEKQQANEDKRNYRVMYLHRQFLDSKYITRTASISTTFNPYITPGFPGVVFDCEDTNMSFAGYVTAVSHRIAKDSVTTNVEMVYVRTCSEAAAIYITHPLEELNIIYHSTECMSKIYNYLIGTGDQAHTPLGCEAITFDHILSEYGPESDSKDSDTNPQNNPREAYKLQQHGVCTFDNYLSFMDLKSSVENGVEGDSTPTRLSGTYVEDRAPLGLFQSIVVDKETYKKTGAVKSKDMEVTMQGKTPEDKKEEINPLDLNGHKKNDTQTTVSQVSVLRDVLYKIAKEEFANAIYA